MSVQVSLTFGSGYLRSLTVDEVVVAADEVVYSSKLVFLSDYLP